MLSVTGRTIQQSILICRIVISAFWYRGNILFLKSLHICCAITMFGRDLSLKISPTHTGTIVRVFVCQPAGWWQRMRSGSHAWIIHSQELHASVPRNSGTWGTSANETQRRFWMMEAGAERGRSQGNSDGAVGQPRSSPCTSLKVHKLACHRTSRPAPQTVASARTICVWEGGCRF